MSLFHSYAEVKAEQHRELGIVESPPQITVDKVRLLYIVVIFDYTSFSH